MNEHVVVIISPFTLATERWLSDFGFDPGLKFSPAVLAEF